MWIINPCLTETHGQCQVWVGHCTRGNMQVFNYMLSIGNKIAGMNAARLQRRVIRRELAQDATTFVQYCFIQ